MESRTPFTAKDAKKLAGLSYRQLNDWDARGAVPAERDKEGGWRKFTAKQLFALMICNEIRRLYGTPVERLRFVRSFMMQEGADHLAAAIRLMAHGLHVFLLTDLKETFVMDSDLEFRDYMELGYFRVEETRPYVFFRLNEIVNRLLGATKEPMKLKPHDDVYGQKGRLDAALAVRTMPEFHVLRAVRSGKYDRVVVEVKEGLIRFVDVEGHVDNSDHEDEGGTVTVKHEDEFENVTIKRRDGRVVDVKRSLPTKFSVEENAPVLFVGQVNSATKPLTRGRDGEKPSGIAKPKTKTRRDRKTLSREDHGAPPGRTRVRDAQSRKVPKDSR
uniref:HTH merR-type domain-containing protein n=1 Tax=uncultured gamma proteobacterium HF4000_48E10 TaxID=723583 RepID=E7C8R4_9GAMM|nr:hypothetical protein [uncultured gamma proteobacterium HF4000_48E10]